MEVDPAINLMLSQNASQVVMRYPAALGYVVTDEARSLSSRERRVVIPKFDFDGRWFLNSDDQIAQSLGDIPEEDLVISFRRIRSTINMPASIAAAGLLEEGVDSQFLEEFKLITDSRKTDSSRTARLALVHKKAETSSAFGAIACGLESATFTRAMADLLENNISMGANMASRVFTNESAGAMKAALSIIAILRARGALPEDLITNGMRLLERTPKKQAQT